MMLNDNKWKTVKLKDLLSYKGYIRGPFGSALRRGEMQQSGIPVYEQEHAINEIRHFRYFIDEKKYNELKRFTVVTDDIIISCSGTVGRISVIKKNDPIGIISQALLILRSNPDIVDVNYLKYFLRSKVGQNALLERSNGSVQVNICKREIIEEIPVPLPSLDTQKNIAQILSSLDDKIELNTQINHNLEEQAKAIFKSWFVDFEPFAGKEPDGSKMVDLQSICELVTKGTTPTTLGFAFTQDGINFIKAESISDTHSFDIDKFSYIDQQTNYALKRSIIQDGDILFTIAGTLGRFAIADKSILPANTNQAVAIIRPKLTEAHPYYIYSFLLGGWHTEHYRKRVQQAVQANLSLTTIKSLPILLLPETLKQQYENIITPLFKKILQNTLENRTICKLRDALLPKLMTGEIDVSEVEV